MHLISFKKKITNNIIMEFYEIIRNCLLWKAKLKNSENIEENGLLAQNTLLCSVNCCEAV